MKTRRATLRRNLLRLAAVALVAALLGSAAGCARPSGARVTVVSGIPKYTLSMNSTPGLPLEVRVDGYSDASALETTWTCDHGGFLTWGAEDGFVVRNRGAVFTRTGTALLWTPADWSAPTPSPFATTGTTTVTVEVRAKDTKALLGTATVHIDCDGFWYNLRENAS